MICFAIERPFETFIDKNAYIIAMKNVNQTKIRINNSKLNTTIPNIMAMSVRDQYCKNTELAVRLSG